MQSLTGMILSKFMAPGTTYSEPLKSRTKYILSFMYYEAIFGIGGGGHLIGGSPGLGSLRARLTCLGSLERGAATLWWANRQFWMY
jgi:hypothetical protein